jgi:REP element-mobilizing transposase RayT
MYDHDIHHRQSHRWRKHDYSSPGFYYVTICIQDYRCLLGNVSAGMMNLNDAGRMVDAAWSEIPTRFPTMRLDEHMAMPNHFHGITEITVRQNIGDRGAPLVGLLKIAPEPATAGAGTRPAPTLGDAVGAFKSVSTDEYIKGVNELGWPRFRGRFWERNYYDHVIHDQYELEKIRQYIRQNPLMWSCDRYNPENSVLVLDETGHVVPWDES